MNFIFECSTQYLTSEGSSLVRYQVEHEKTKFIPTSGELYKHTNNDFFDDFPKISEHFPKISEDARKVVRHGQPIISEHFPNISEDYRRFPRKKL